MGCKKYARFTFHFIIKDKRKNRNYLAIYYTYYAVDDVRKMAKKEKTE